MPRMTGNRYFAEAMQAYGVTHVFFVPTIMLPAMAKRAWIPSSTARGH